MANQVEKLTHLRKLADTMDSAFEIPGLRMRIGLDGIVGLIPGIGDVFGLAVSAYFILVAAQLQVPAPVLARMFVNVAVDSAIGSIPFFGDIFDFAWKSNRKNLALLEQSVLDPRTTKKNSILFLAGIGIVLLAALVLVMIAVGWIVTLLFSALQSLF